MSVRYSKRRHLVIPGFIACEQTPGAAGANSTSAFASNGCREPGSDTWLYCAPNHTACSCDILAALNICTNTPCAVTLTRQPTTSMLPTSQMLVRLLISNRLIVAEWACLK
ncbi:hypothetical protein AYI70_g1006 [Smittium culicis]|uniref:Uncharacterized protein n=1 Tax=Smittium culicis TaxID=133412 RepID=A0A1R1YEH0_9FUNG|nr:hypothetical protein AYI70_g1006 [Smittium culicis]